MACRAGLRSSSCRINKRSATKTLHPASALPQRNWHKTSSSQLCEAISLKIQQSFLEKKQKLLIGTLKNLEPYLMKDLNDMNEELNLKRLKEHDQLKKDVVAIVHLLKDIKKNTVVENLQEIEIEHLKENLMELERKISALRDIFKKQSTILLRQEQQLHEHVASMARKIDEWGKPSKVDKILPNIHHNSAFISNGSSYNECVNQFQKFLRDRGGHTGGWDETDHLIFIRLLSKHENKHTLYSHLHHEFPDKTLEAICEHDQWYTEYEDLKAKQKQAIAEWRVSKNNSISRTVSCSERLPLQVISKYQLKEDPSEYREHQKQQLEKWKNMKEQELQIKALKKKEEQEKRLIEEEAKKMRHATQKAELERYREQKLRKELAVALQKEALENIQAEERACNANKILKAFRQRDAESLARQKEMKCRVERERKDKEKALEALRQKVRVEVARDPHRLLRPTGAWRERTKTEKGLDPVSSRSSMPLNVQEVPHLGVPLWRKNQK